MCQHILPDILTHGRNHSIQKIKSDTVAGDFALCDTKLET
ncbi:hypothetical protein BD31_I0590 [Candidatus Nitrosopumilus salaria BD31]|uniref:Uncharacterized protein n=1 Tax=Candidatus Nitrosopumilus salarius BD31 TaxID=859350 RepID=I3D302_9ARCH|nr:hypothetical protein BD31_I0590 [Candidatus Nitrosopumilus salaria BD31]